MVIKLEKIQRNGRFEQITSFELVQSFETLPGELKSTKEGSKHHLSSISRKLAAKEVYLYRGLTYYDM
jgi:hypothetical protein